MLINISHFSELTLQEQIIGEIRARILNGELESDYALMSIRALSQSLRVSINTVQRAYEELLKEGLIYAKPGKGFFVAALKKGDKAENAKQRFSHSLQDIIKKALREGLSEEEITHIFNQLKTGAKNNGNT